MKLLEWEGEAPAELARHPVQQEPHPPVPSLRDIQFGRSLTLPC